MSFSVILHKFFTIFLAFLPVCCMIVSSGCSENRCYLEQPEASVNAPSAGNSENLPVDIHFFFDRTESMKGFTQFENNNKYSENTHSHYKETMPIIVNAVQNIKNGNSKYYQYGDTQITEMDRNKVLSTNSGNPGVRMGAFYGIKNGIDREPFVPGSRELNGRPFSKVNRFIYTELTEGDDDGKKLFIIVTDFYETDSPDIFKDFFQSAFNKGFSGAIFAIDSEFAGVVYDVLENKKGFPVAGNVKNAFFVLIAGNNEELLQYCEKLINDLHEMQIVFNNSIFMAGRDTTVSAMPDEAERAGSKRDYEEYDSNTPLNFDLLETGSAGLYYLTANDEGDAEAVPADLPAYRINPGYRMRFIAALAEIPQYLADNYNYNCAWEIEYFEGDNSHAADAGISEFTGIKRKNYFDAVVSIGSATRNMQSLCLIIETAANENTNAVKEMENGFYRFSFNVQANAHSRPKWVDEKSANNLSDFEESSNNGRLKILNFRKVYSDIAEVYNNSKTAPSFSGNLFFIKR
ncbi:MAG: hypothetical protein FWH41_02590 [Treponema sp.]|nr:hypothetical protein [Treponema sp.]